MPIVVSRFESKVDMSFIQIDQEKCHRDGLCAMDCPMGIITHQKGELPVGIANAAELCVGCGHCVSICPHGAISLPDVNASDCTPIAKDLRISQSQSAQFLKARRSIRQFQDKPVPREELAKLVDVASYAPSGHNAQPLSFLVIEDSKEVHRLAGIVVKWMRSLIEQKSPLVARMHLDRVVAEWDAGNDRICRGAPHVILAYAPKLNPMAQGSATIALTYLELAAFGMGLGACWAGYFSAAAQVFPEMAEALALPEEHGCFGAMMIGHSQVKYKRIPPRNVPRIQWR